MESVNSIFEKASRQRIRFETAKGALAVEDLWDLPLTVTRPGAVSLDNIAIGLHKQLKEAGDSISFVTETTTAGKTELQLKFDVVKYIIDVRVAENKAEREKTERAQKKQQLLAILDRKENAELEGKSADEIRAMIAAM